jgi:hypothetical protein
VNGYQPGASWRRQLLEALALVLLVACGIRTAADLLAPLLPVLIVLTVLAAITWLLLRR